MKKEFLKLTDKYSIEVNGNLNDDDDNFSIFNSQRFLNLHSDKYKNLFTFSLHEINTGKSLGVSIFNCKEEGLFISPIIGSYGGFEFHENIDFQTKESFIENGGENFHMIPCLNDSDDHIKLFEHLVKRYIPR